MKTDKNFRLHQSTKRMLAGILDAHDSGSIKRAMIRAQLASEQQQRRRAAPRSEASND
jgi:hypothetical protein